MYYKSFPEDDEINRTYHGEKDCTCILRPEDIKMKQVPVKWRNNINPVAPFNLKRVKQQVEETVSPKNKKHFLGMLTQQRESCREYQTQQQACLCSKVKSEVVWVECLRCQKYFQLYPRKIRQDTGNDYPEKFCSFQDYSV